MARAWPFDALSRTHGACRTTPRPFAPRPPQPGGKERRYLPVGAGRGRNLRSRNRRETSEGGTSLVPTGAGSASGRGRSLGPDEPSTSKMDGSLPASIGTSNSESATRTALPPLLGWYATGNCSLQECWAAGWPTCPPALDGQHPAPPARQDRPVRPRP